MSFGLLTVPSVYTIYPFFLIRRRIFWLIHGKPSRVSAFLVRINFSVPCSGLLANISHSSWTSVVAMSVRSSDWKSLIVCLNWSIQASGGYGPICSDEGERFLSLVNQKQRQGESEHALLCKMWQGKGDIVVTGMAVVPIKQPSNLLMLCCGAQMFGL